MTSVLLIVPPQSEIKDVKQTGLKWLRTGIAYIAAYLRERDVIVKVLDCKGEEIDQKGALNRISDIRPDIIGISAFTEEILEAVKIFDGTKRIDKNIITVIGGAHASAIPEETLAEFENVDIAVFGEGEETLWDIVKMREIKDLTKRDLSTIDGIAYRNGKKIIRNQPRSSIKNIDLLPYPAWDLFPLHEYKGITTITLSEKGFGDILELPILSARGCPYKCKFCYKAYGKGSITRDYLKVVDEIEFDINKYGTTQFFFTEGTFGANKKFSLNLCNEIIKRKLNDKIKWVAETRVDTVDEESLNLMKKAGCALLSLGVESGDTRILEKIGKGISKEQARLAVKMTKKVGIPVECFFIIGHPYETKESIQHTMDFAKELDPDQFNVGIMIPYPGTKIMEMAEKGEGNYRLLTKDWSEYTKQRGGPLELKDISITELRKIQSINYLRFYLHPKKLPYIIKNIPPMKLVKIGFDVLKNIF